MSEILSNNHWTLEDYKQRMKVSEWREILLKGRDRLVVCGRFRQLVARNLGAWVVEISKAPLEVEDDN